MKALKMELRKNKYFLIVLIISFCLIIWYLFFRGYQDYSELNDLVEKECIIDGVAKKTCIVDFHKLDFEWDDIYYFGGGEQGYVDSSLGSKNIVIVNHHGTYMVFTKNKELVTVYQHHYDNWGDLLPDDNMNILILPKWNKNKEDITHCQNDFLLKREYNYSNDYKVVYFMSCVK